MSALRSQNVDLVGVDLVEHIVQPSSIRDFAAVQMQFGLDLGNRMDIVDPVRVGQGSPPEDSRHLIARDKSNSTEVATALASDSNGMC